MDERPRERVAELAQLVVRDPHSVPRRLDLAAALIGIDRREDGIALLRDVALRYAEDGQLVQAIAVCRGILELDPSHEETVALLSGFVEKKSRGAVADEPVGFAEHEEEDTAVGDRGARLATPVDDEDDDIDTSELVAQPRDRASDGDDAEDPTSPGQGPVDAEPAEDTPTDPIEEALLRSAADSSDSTVELPAFPLLSDLPRAAFMELLHEVRILERHAGDVVIEEGSEGDAFYLIADGTVRVRKGDVEVAILGPGSFFGEFALLADQRRHATVEATSSVRLVEVTRALLDRLVDEHPGVARILRAFYGDRLLATLLQTAPFFAQLSPEERADVAGRFRPRRFGRGATIIEEGTSGGGLYLVLVGEVEIVRNDDAGVVELGRLGEGSYFGEMSLLKGASASATVRASRLCETVQLPPRDFYEIVARHPVLWDQLRSAAQERELSNVAILAGEARSGDDGRVYLV